MNASESLVVVLSGCHAGPNPSPGLGTALSIRSAFPKAVLIAKDHSPQASGLHHPVFDDVVCFRPWNELDLSHHRSQLAQLVERHAAVFISGLDLEVHWIAAKPFPGALVPPHPALLMTRKPDMKAAARLPVRIPKSIDVTAGHDAVYEFCTDRGWNVWLKGPAYEARRVRSWSELQAALDELETTWGAEIPCFVQEHIPGFEVCIAFAAFQGELLQAILLEKRFVTPEGKTWAGAVTCLREPLLSSLRQIVRELRWTGGAELEFVRSSCGELWLIDWNPRFPAWIHGASICGYNLPAQLVARALRLQRFVGPNHRSTQFTRVVVEVPVRPDLPLPPPFEHHTATGSGKHPTANHPSGMPLLMRRADGPLSTQRAGYATTRPRTRPCETEDAMTEFLGVWSMNTPTPARIFLPHTAQRRFGNVASSLRTMTSSSGLEFRAAYSIKTNPDRRLLGLARDSGMMAEAISPDEVSWAITCGFNATEVVYNGPLPATASFSSNYEPLLVVFADSCRSLKQLIDTDGMLAAHIGARLRLPAVASRFGIRLDDLHEFDRLCRAFQAASTEVPLALSFHIQSSVVGLSRWGDMVDALIDASGCIQSATGRTFAMLDLGGGWTPEGLERLLKGGLLAHLTGRIRRELPTVRTVILEPGKALAEPSMLLVSRVLEVRKLRNELVVDAGLSELPLAHEVARTVYHVDKLGAIAKLGTGQGRILGRLCMENDVLVRHVEVPERVVEGDLIVFASAGAYDASMSYSFGRGAKTNSGGY